MMQIFPSTNEKKVALFCDAFLHDTLRPKYVMGRCPLAQSVAKVVNVDGFIDDFTTQTIHLGKPIVTLEAVPSDALVLVASSVRTASAMKRVLSQGYEACDYFSFYKYSKAIEEDLYFLKEDFEGDFHVHRERYEAIYQRLSDAQSQREFNQLINYRLTYDLSFLEGITCNVQRQYFEPFLKLQRKGESFADVGAYDGLTSREFIAHCPDFHALYLFEPDMQNLEKAKANLSGHDAIRYIAKGLSNERKTVRFSRGDSSSKISDEGDITIEIDQLDNLGLKQLTFLKMDIEGSEIPALQGATRTIQKFRPRLAICVYHHAGDFWKIPETVDAIASGYELYFRHYTESQYESVMFFMPKAP